MTEATTTTLLAVRLCRQAAEREPIKRKKLRAALAALMDSVAPPSSSSSTSDSRLPDLAARVHAFAAAHVPADHDNSAWYTTLLSTHFEQDLEEMRLASPPDVAKLAWAIRTVASDPTATLPLDQVVVTSFRAVKS
jgi:hypothetical protein